MAIFLTSRDVGALLDVGDYIEIIERAYEQLGNGASSMLPRIKVDAARRSGFLKILPASLSETGIAGIHAYTGGGKGDFLKTVLLFDIKSGDLEAVIESDRIGWLTPGAVSAVAVKHLARRDAKVMGIFGSGRQARSQLLAVSCVRDLEMVKVFSPQKGHRDAFCAEMVNTIGIPVLPVDSPETAIEGAHIVSAATNARTPVFEGKKIEAGTHINAVGAHDPGRREVDASCVKRSKIVVDSLERAFKEEGALILAMGEGAIDADHVYGELGEIVARKKPGREREGEVTMFLSGATAVEYVAIGAEVYRRAKEKGMGQKLSLTRDETVPRSLHLKIR